jgi:hypothetical protein
MRERKPIVILTTNESAGASALLFAETGMTALQYRRIPLE